MEYEATSLKNGIKIIHKETSSMISHCGIIINAGSRDESPEEHGMAHFIEHVLFKGTKKRKAYHILSRIEDAGGEINAYTTKEETCIHTSFLKNDYARSLELMSDLIINSVFPENEIQKEKEIIIDEINSYKDNPAELIFDEFEELIFPGDPIGRNILGSPEYLQKFTKNDVLAFMQKNYTANEMVICSVGNIKFQKLEKLCEKYFCSMSGCANTKNRSKYTNYVPVKSVKEKNTYQAHCLMGNVAYNIKDGRRIGLQLLNNILGGHGLNSRLNLSLREKNGYAYNVESNYNPYIDTGVISIYFGTDKEHLDKSMKLVYKEMNKLKTTQLGVLQLSRAKKQLMGQIAISMEMHENLMLALGKSYLIFNKVDSFKEICHKIEQISAGQLLEIANEVLDEKQLSILIYH
jgi:predicted Zn-dependent peptidase